MAKKAVVRPGKVRRALQFEAKRSLKKASAAAPGSGENRKKSHLKSGLSKERLRKGLPTPSKVEGSKAGKPIKSELSVERLKQIIQNVKNRGRRQKFALQLKKAKDKEKAQRKAEGGPKKVPHTIETLRRADETIITKEDENEISQLDESDEFSDYFNQQSQPKLLLTTNRKPSKHLLKLIQEFLLIIPNIYYYPRKHYRIQSISKYAIKKNFTDVLVITERLSKPAGLYICHLPEGPTSYFKLSSVKLAQDMHGSAAATDHQPEILLNNFSTRLGRRVARQLASLFPQNPEFQGRRLLCFHNQRDFIFLRHMRYGFDSEKQKFRLQEIGPRLTLKLRWLQHGLFDPRAGLYEFYWRPDLQVDRKRMFI